MGERHFKKKYKGVEVGIMKSDGSYYFEFTNYGSDKERADAIDHFNEEYQFENW